MSTPPDSTPAVPAARKRRWLILSHDFNMDGRAPSLTITDKIAHLMAAGIEPVVLSAVSGTRDERFPHEQLLPWGPGALRFDLRHVWALRLGRGLRYRVLTLLVSLLLAPLMLLERLACGLRSHWSWALPACVGGLRWLRRGGIELVYSTGGPYSAHLAGYWIKRRTGCVWIAEVHDPMVKPGLLPRTREERMQARIEQMICEHADLAWWFTDSALASARRRHSALGERGMSVLPGADPPLHRVAYTRGEHFVMAHFGSLSATRSLAPAVVALGEILRREPGLRARVRLEVFGAALDAQARDAVAQAGLADVVLPMGRLEHDPRRGLSGREQVVERMQQVDVLLIVHGVLPDCSEYIPSKLYDYFWARRPVLALTHQNPQFDALVAEHGGWAVPITDPAAVAAALRNAIERWEAAALPDVQVPAISVADAVGRIIAGAERAIQRRRR